MERLAITVEEANISRHVALAREHNIGIEVQYYGYNPNVLDGEWPSLLESHKTALLGFEGEVAFHGAFYDMTGSSIDQGVVALTRQRYLSCMQIAAELGACNIVFHANYLPFIHHPKYRPDWTERQVAFWQDLIGEAERLGLVIALENMWEPEPGIIADVLEQVDSPHLCACLDVGHVHLYSDSLPIRDWIVRLKDRLVHCHINNPRGLYDEHLSLNAKGGMIDYEITLPMLKALQPAPLICLEMDDLEDLERSLRYLGR